MGCHYSALLPAALAFFHLALAIADNLALLAALIFRLAFLAGLAEVFPFIFAHLALAPAAILARADLDIFLLVFRANGDGISPPPRIC